MQLRKINAVCECVQSHKAIWQIEPNHSNTQKLFSWQVLFVYNNLTNEFKLEW